MTWLDIVIAAFLGALFILGFKRGLINTIFPLVGIAAAIILSFHFYSPLANSLSQWIENPTHANIIAFAIIFALVIAGALALAAFLKYIFSVFFLGWVDRLGGAVLGLAIGGLIPASILVILTKLHFTAVENTFRDSSLAPFLLNSFNSVLSFIPKEYDAVRQLFG